MSIVFFAINIALPFPAKGFTKNKMVFGDEIILEKLFLKDKIIKSKVSNPDAFLKYKYGKRIS
jgi:hypothetical protein